MRQYIFIAFSIMVLLSGCTRNNGDIGQWFGTWHLYEIEVDKITDDVYQGNVVWAFQSAIIKMTVVNAYHQTDEYWGTWEEADGYLSLNYTHSNAETLSGNNEYGFPPNIYLPANGIVTLRITEQTGKRLSLEYTNADGKKIFYRLRKQI